MRSLWNPISSPACDPPLTAVEFTSDRREYLTATIGDRSADGL